MDRPEKTLGRIANELAIGNDIALARLHVDSHRLDRAMATTAWVNRWLALQNAVDRSRYPNSYCPKCADPLEIRASELEAGGANDIRFLVCSNQECIYEREI